MVKGNEGKSEDVNYMQGSIEKTTHTHGMKQQFIYINIREKRTEPM